jgi:hypothetical protein
VGPRWLDGNRGEAELLEKVYRNIFELASRSGIESITIPVFSTSIRPPIPRTFGHPFHDDPATYSTVIRPV